jgi:CDP-glucose 4,6-dehydratase
MFDWNGKNVLVTGGNGFLGSWLVNDLVQKGANVTCIVKDPIEGSNIEMLGIVDNIKAVKGDVADFDCVKKAMRESNTEVCFHIAAQAIVGIANKNPTQTFEANIKGTWVVLEACRQLGVKRVVVASSDKAYGEHEKLPYKEDFCLNGLTPYETSKSCTDLIARTYANTYGMAVAVTRCGNIYGGGDMNMSRIIPGTILSVLKDESPIIRSDGTPIRDYIYVLDIVNAYITLAEQLDRTEVIGKAFNFGTKTPVSVLDLAKKIIQQAGKSIEPNVLNEAKNELQEQYLDWSMAKEVLGWQPQFDLDKGLKETIDWYRDYQAKKGQ